MIPENVFNAYEKVKAATILQSRGLHRKEWEVLFGYYNINLPKGQQALGMNCTPCYYKVLLFIEAKLKQLVGEKSETKEDAEAKKG